MAVTTADLTAIKEKTAPLLGQAPWAAQLGYGSFVTLDFGRRLPPSGPGERRRGEWHLWVQHVAWRIEAGGDVLAGCEDPRSRMAAAIEHMRGRALLAFDVQDPALDTTLAFHGGLVFRAFPIHSEEYPHWWLFTPEGNVLEAGPGAAWSYASASLPWSPSLSSSSGRVEGAGRLAREARCGEPE